MHNNQSSEADEINYYFSYETSIGKLTIISTNNGISEIRFGEINDSNHKSYPNSYVKEETQLGKQAQKQLEEYFQGNRTSFDLPLSMQGTLFQKKVWNALMQIPFGETRTYKQIAKDIGNPNACRAVGMANNKNPIPIIIPCHRVIGSNGLLVGYAWGLHIKEILLKIEKSEYRLRIK